MFELHFLIHLAPLMHHLLPLSYLLFFPTFLLIHLSIRAKKGECMLSLFLYDSCAHSQGEKFYLVHIRKGRNPQGRCIYQGGEDIEIIRKFCFVYVYLCLFSCLLYGALSYVEYLCFAVLIASCLNVGHAYILMLFCFIECMFR